MKASIVCAPFPMTFDVTENLHQMLALLNRCEPHDVVVFPEASLSGYSDDITFLAGINQQQVHDGLETLHALARNRNLHVFFGACREDEHGWRNQAYYLAATGERAIYNKANLPTHERGHLIPGDRLPIFDLQLPQGTLRVAVQLCRELRFPDQWRVLAESGADLFVYMTHLIEDAPRRPVWRSHLISRAAENQRWIAAVNVAHPVQGCPSMLIDPFGMVIDETFSEHAGRMRADIDTDAISNWYLSQQRTDLTRG